MLSDSMESHGPTVHLCWDKPYDFPDSGEMCVKFRVKRREQEISKDGKQEFSICLELLEIEEIEAEEGSTAPANSYDEAGKALDSLRAEMEDEED